MGDDTNTPKVPYQPGLSPRGTAGLDRTIDFKSFLPIEQTQGQVDMMLRDWFAGMALIQIAQLTTMRNSKDVAECCYQLADDLLAERNKRQKGGA